MSTALFPDRLRDARDAAERDYFTQGYCRVEGLMAPHLIDALLQAYRAAVLPFQGAILRHTGKAEPNQFRNGHLTVPILNPHDRNQTPGLESFADALTRLLVDPALVTQAGRLAGGPVYLTQSLFFDLCPEPETHPHQDHVYLDSRPPGHLLGVWIALEDIHADAGPLYLLPWTATPPPPRFTRADVFEDEGYKSIMREWIAPLRAHLHAPAMKKGDVIFWNSRVVHGAMPPADRERSRLSVACHYLPENMKVGNIFGDAYDTLLERVNGVAVRVGRIR